MSTRLGAGGPGTSSISNKCRRFSLSGLFEDRRFHACLIAAMALPVLFARLHQGDLGGYDSAVYAHEGKQMLATGEWWTVYLNGQPDFDKPPMFVWLEAISMAVFGVSDFAARFPSALLGFAVRHSSPNGLAATRREPVALVRIAKLPPLGSCPIVTVARARTFR